MRKKILSIGIATLLLVSILCVGNLGATAEAENILAGKLPVAVETEATNANSQAKTNGLTILDNAAALTDGTAASGSLYLPGCQPLSDNNAHQCGQVKVYFDLGDTYALDTAKIVSAGTTQHKYIYNMAVYAAAIPAALFSSDSQVASLNSGYNKNTNKTNTLTLDTATVTARYVGFAFYTPAAYETSWTNFWNGQVQVEELAVYGTKIAPNILAGKLPSWAPDSKTGAATYHTSPTATAARCLPPIPATPKTAGDGSPSRWMISRTSKRFPSPPPLRAVPSICTRLPSMSATRKQSCSMRKTGSSTMTTTRAKLTSAIHIRWSRQPGGNMWASLCARTVTIGIIAPASPS